GVLYLSSCGSGELNLAEKLARRIRLSEHPFIEVVPPRARLSFLPFSSLTDINALSIAERLNADLSKHGFTYVPRQVRHSQTGKAFQFELQYQGVPVCDFDIKAREMPTESRVRLMSNVTSADLDHIRAI